MAEEETVYVQGAKEQTEETEYVNLGEVAEVVDEVLGSPDEITEEI